LEQVFKYLWTENTEKISEILEITFHPSKTNAAGGVMHLGKKHLECHDCLRIF